MKTFFKVLFEYKKLTFVLLRIKLMGNIVGSFIDFIPLYSLTKSYSFHFRLLLSYYDETFHSEQKLLRHFNDLQTTP